MLSSRLSVQQKSSRWVLYGCCSRHRPERQGYASHSRQSSNHPFAGQEVSPEANSSWITGNNIPASIESHLSANCRCPTGSKCHLLPIAMRSLLGCAIVCGCSWGSVRSPPPQRGSWSPAAINCSWWWMPIFQSATAASATAIGPPQFAASPSNLARVRSADQSRTTP